MNKIQGIGVYDDGVFNNSQQGECDYEEYSISISISISISEVPVPMYTTQVSYILQIQYIIYNIFEFNQMHNPEREKWYEGTV